jgi:hypothetical protein
MKTRQRSKRETYRRLWNCETENHMNAARITRANTIEDIPGAEEGGEDPAPGVSFRGAYSQDQWRRISQA